MTSTRLLERKSISVSDFRCTAGPGDKPFAEQHSRHSISYVRKGSFGLHCRGKFSELVAGSVLIGHPGDEYTCTHEHVCGYECLSFFLAPELVEAIGDSPTPWQIGAAPPLPELVVLGELAQSAADGSSDIGLDEIGQVLTWPATHDEVVAASKLVPDDIVQMITASGTPDEVRAKVDEYVATGCTCPILYPLGDDVHQMIDVFATS